MSKIICEICGTSYPETAECCPICGCSRDAASDLLGEELLAEETFEEVIGKEDAASSRKKQIFDYDEVNGAPAPEQTVEVSAELEEEEEEEEPRANTFVVILLTLLIALLLLAAGFIFVKYFLPNMGGKEADIPATTEAVVQETAPAPTTELRIPCETLILNSGPRAEIKQAGFNHLVNVTVSPVDTTDEVSFFSADESIATVTADGKITAVADGETIVTVACGAFSFDIQVVCDFSQETVPPTEETVPVEIQETEAEEEEAPVQESKAPVDPSIELKLKQFDISLGVYYEVQLKLDCNLDPTDVEWSSEHPHIASVDENGNVRALKAGTTDIIARYGDQEVRCKVRCSY